MQGRPEGCLHGTAHSPAGMFVGEETPRGGVLSILDGDFRAVGPPPPRREAAQYRGSPCAVSAGPGAHKQSMRGISAAPMHGHHPPPKRTPVLSARRSTM